MTIFYSVNAKIHAQLIFCTVATLMVHPRIMKIHKNLPGDIPNIFPFLYIWPVCPETTETPYQDEKTVKKRFVAIKKRPFYCREDSHFFFKFLIFNF